MLTEQQAQELAQQYGMRYFAPRLDIGDYEHQFTENKPDFPTHTFAFASSVQECLSSKVQEDEDPF